VSSPQPSDGPEVDAAVLPPIQRPRRIWLFAAVAVFALAVDLISKIIVVAKLPIDHMPVRILGGAVYLDQARNSGAAFSVGTGATIVLTAVAVVIVLVILRVAARMRSIGWAVALGLILGGAIGNLLDRFFRAPGGGKGHVVDWISLFGPNAAHWPIFNLADSAICCGAVTAAIVAILGIDINGTRKK
jgi:signal peptidase II